VFEHVAAFRGIQIEDLHTAYRQFCKKETVQSSPMDIGEVIEFYNRTLSDLPNDVTVVVWVGYDNGNGRRRTLGTGQTGAHVALPIFRSIIEAVWEHGSAKSPLDPPSAEASRMLVSEQPQGAGRERSRGTGRGVDEARAGRVRHRFSARTDQAALVPRAQWDWRGQWDWR
jgi:hypothetical protein